MKKQNKDFLLDLERERLDQSWKQRKEIQATEFTRIVYRTKPVDHRFRDNIMFQAGRYAAGVRDAEALNGHRVAKNLTGGN